MSDENNIFENGNENLSEIGKLFKSKEYCFQQIREARQMFGEKSTTKIQYEAMEKALAFGVVYCPPSIQCAFEATLHEAGLRKMFYIMSVWNT